MLKTTNDIGEFKQKLMNHVTNLKDDNDIKGVLKELISEIDFVKIYTFDDFEERVHSLTLYQSEFDDEDGAREYLRANSPALYKTVVYTDKLSYQTTSASELASSLKFCKLQKAWHKEAEAFKLMFKPLFS